MTGGTIQFNPQPPQNQNQNNTAPANIFAQMKAGTFAQGDSEPQPSNKYDALRATNRESIALCYRGWGTHPDLHP